MNQNSNLTINEVMELSNSLIENTKRQIILTTDLSNRIKKNLSTKKILYEDYKEAFDYVGEIFPDIDVKSIDVRQATPVLLKKLGYDGIGGFFERISKTVVISAWQISPFNSNRNSVRAKLQRDEVIVHELLHYCHDTINSSSSVNMKEEFAYGWSLGYLRGKSYSDEDIIKDNYMPYLYNVCYKDGFLNILKEEEIGLEKMQKLSSIAKNRIANRLRHRIHKEVLRLATEKGQEIIRIYEKRIADGKSYSNMNKPKHTLFDKLDFD